MQQLPRSCYSPCSFSGLNLAELLAHGSQASRLHIRSHSYLPAVSAPAAVVPDEEKTNASIHCAKTTFSRPGYRNLIDKPYPILAFAYFFEMKQINDEEDSESSWMKFLADRIGKDGGDSGSNNLRKNNELDVSLKFSDLLDEDGESSIESSLGSSYQEPLLDDELSEAESGVVSKQVCNTSQLWEGSSTESSLLSEELEEESESDSLVDDDDFHASLQSAGFFRRFGSGDSTSGLSKITEHSRETTRSLEDPSYHLKSPTASSRHTLRHNSPLKTPRPSSCRNVETRILDISLITESDCEIAGKESGPR